MGNTEDEMVNVQKKCSSVYKSHLVHYSNDGSRTMYSTLSLDSLTFKTSYIDRFVLFEILFIKGHCAPVRLFTSRHVFSCLGLYRFAQSG